MDDGLWMIDVIRLGTVCFLLVKFVIFINKGIRIIKPH